VNSLHVLFTVRLTSSWRSRDGVEMNLSQTESDSVCAVLSSGYTCIAVLSSEKNFIFTKVIIIVLTKHY